MKKQISVLMALAMSTFVSAQKTDSIATKAGEEMAEVVVTGTRNTTDIRHLPMTVNVINRQQIERQHQSSVLPLAMQQVPSLFVTSRSMLGYGVSTGSAGGINLRGLTGGAGQLLVLIDGHPQYNGIYGHPISDSYQSVMAERIEVVRSPASVIYGSNAMGGVINIVTRQAKTDGIYNNINIGTGSYGTVETNATNMVRNGKFFQLVSAQYNRTDNHRPRMGFEQYGGHIKLGYDFTTHWNVQVDFDINHFNSSYPGTTERPMFEANQWITRGDASVSLRNHYEHTSGEISVYNSFGRHKIDDGTDNPANPTKRYFRSKDALTGISWFQTIRPWTGNTTTMGIDYQHAYGHAYYTSKETDKVLDTPNKQSGKSHRNEIATYIEMRQDLLQWLTLDAGIRFNHHSIVGNKWIPQAGFVARPLSNGEIKAMASKGYRNPTMREMYLYPPSNEDLKPEQLWNYELSWRHRVADLRYGVNLFYIKGDNMIQTINRKNINTGEIENCGIELEASYSLTKHITIETNNSRLHMHNRVVGSPKYKSYIGGTYSRGKLSVSLGVQEIAGLYTAVGENEKHENFTLLSLNASYKLMPSMTLWARGDNLLAQKYEINDGYPMPRATFMAGVSLSF